MHSTGSAQTFLWGNMAPICMSCSAGHCQRHGHRLPSWRQCTVVCPSEERSAKACSPQRCVVAAVQVAEARVLVRELVVANPRRGRLLRTLLHACYTTQALLRLWAWHRPRGARGAGIEVAKMRRNLPAISRGLLDTSPCALCSSLGRRCVTRGGWPGPQCGIKIRANCTTPLGQRSAAPCSQ
jgi:hypothetical protein